MKQAHRLRQHARSKNQPDQRQEVAPQHDTTAHQQPLQRALHALPGETSARGLRQASVLQMQQTHGNAFVQRQVPGGDTASEPQGDAGPGASPSELSSGGSTVSVTPGGVDVSGGVVNVSAAMTRVSGVLSADTLTANNVISSSYTPGVGNIM